MPKTTTESGSTSSRTRKAPSVLVILVVKDGEAWVRATLAALAKQKYPRLGVIAVDNGSTDSSPEILRTMLGEVRVVTLKENRGFPAAVAEGLRRAGSAGEAEYLLLLHDDTVLSTGALTRLVETAERIDGVGVVGPKVVDWDDPTILREVGLSADRFGYPYSPLEEEELDQGQYDRARDVLFVSSSAMLVSRAAWQRIGLPDERYGSHFEDLDFCWRARLAGFRVVMTPRAVVRHRAASFRDERKGTLAARRSRYYSERAALASILKNYSVLTLLWILPLYAVLGVGRILLFLLERRFAEVTQILAAWGWNLAHLPGTVRRRVRSQAVRTVPDRDIRRFMAPAGIRVRRLFQAGAAVLFGRGHMEEEDIIERPPLRQRAGSYALSHPVAVAWFAAALVALFAFRSIWGASPLTGGALAPLPPGSGGFLRAFASGWRDSGLGGAQPASPAVAVWWLGSLLTFGSPGLFLKVLLMGLPAVAGASAYRATYLVGGQRGPAAVAAGAYGLSAGVLYAFSKGRIDLLVLFALAPWTAHRFWSFFDRALPARPIRWLIGGGLGLALGAAFHPGIVLAAGLVVITGLFIPGRQGGWFRGLRFSIGAFGVAAALLFPTVLQYVRAPGALYEGAGRPEVFELLRGALGSGPGTWAIAAFLPLSALIALAFVDRAHGRWAARAVLASLLGTGLAWASAADYLPAFLSDPAAYLAVAVFGYALLVGLALTSISIGVERHAFGARQLAFAIMGLLVVVGLVGQSFQAVRGAWAIGESREPPSWPVVSEDGSRGPFRVLWLGREGGAEFPAPGGLPEQQVRDGAHSVRLSVTGRDGASAFDIARPGEGDGYAYIRASLREAISGTSRHLGALLAPAGIRYVVAGDGDLPAGIRDRLDGQVDLDLIQSAGGLVIFRNARSFPPQAVIGEPEWFQTAVRGDEVLLHAALAPHPRAVPLSGGGSRFEGSAEPGQAAYLADQGRDWRNRSEQGDLAVPRTAFGWAMAFPVERSGPVVLEFAGQWLRRLELVVLALLWGIALWVTRRVPKAPRP
jgi:GT2 family glycosyltransferase